MEEDSSLSELVVCKATKELLQYVLDCSLRSDGLPGKWDHAMYWDAGPDGVGVYVGKLNDQPITGVSMIQYSDDFAWANLYFCEEQHRRKGYAYKTWKVARAALNPQLNLGLDCSLSKSSMYERDGFTKAWHSTFHYFSVSSILDTYKHLTVPDGITICSATQVHFPKLKLYVEDVVGFTFTQSKVLENLISLPAHTALAAVNNSGDIVGLGVVRETVTLDETGYRLKPLFADNSEIARHLLLALAKEVSPDQKFYACVPSEINAEAKKVQDELMEEGLKFARMYTKVPPPIKKEKYFACFFC